MKHPKYTKGGYYYYYNHSGNPLHIPEWKVDQDGRGPQEYFDDLTKDGCMPGWYLVKKIGDDFWVMNPMKLG